MAKNVYGFWDAGNTVKVGDFVRSYLGRVFKVVSVNDECGWPSNPDYDCPCYDGACEQVEAAVETMSLFVASYPEVFVRERLQAA